ncbi:uncharacterized protein [Musca autumnalis]|uniref:uncharacterized protein n=1 Tax=Musca autumnalis TaxID=221902 RepID=UPI003CF6B9D9
MADLKIERCVLCLDKKRFPVTIECGHSFCFECLERYKSYKKQIWAKKCPICRSDLKEPPGVENNVSPVIARNNTTTENNELEQSTVEATDDDSNFSDDDDDDHMGFDDSDEDDYDSEDDMSYSEDSSDDAETTIILVSFC